MPSILAYTAEVQGKSISLKCSDGRQLVTDNWSDLITYLLMPTDMAVVYHLDHFVDAIATIMPKETQKELQYAGRIFLPDRTKIYYQPTRTFGITYTNEVNFYGLSRYSEEEITDVNALATLAEVVIQAYEAFGIKATKLSSPVAVYDSVLQKLDFPRACDLPDSALEMTQKSAEVMNREWREVFKLGHWNTGEIWDYDLHAAYPSLMAKLPDIRKANYFTANTLPQKYSWGVLEGRLDIVKDVSPFVYQGSDPECYGKGDWDDVITTDLLWLLNRYGIGKFEMKQGWFFQLPPVVGYPFKDTMNQLYDLRSSGDELLGTIAKAVSVGIGGRLMQRFDSGKLGDEFNSIYALMMTSRCMVKVADFIYRNNMQDETISVTVDGVLSTKKIDLPEDKTMGSWRRNPPTPALVASVLYSWLGDKRPAMMKYDDIMALIKANPKASHYGDVDLGMLEYNRKFDILPHSGEGLINNKYTSVPYEIHKSQIMGRAK